MKKWLLFILFIPHLLKAGTVVIHVDTEGWGTIQSANADTAVNTKGAFFWNGTKWASNNTAAHVYFTDLRTGQRLQEYKVVNVSDRTTASTVFDSLSYHIVRQNYQYSYPAKGGGTYKYEAVQYLISDSTAKKVVLRSRGTGKGIGNCYFDIFVEVVPNEVTAIRNDPQWFTYPAGMNMELALGQNSPTQYLTGKLPTIDGYYFMDKNGGSDMGGISYNFHTGPLTGNSNTADLSPSYPIDFMLKFMDSNGQLEEFRFLPKLISETYLPEATTFVLSNEGGLIDDLVRAGHGAKNLYQTLEILKPKSGGIISDEFMATLAKCPAGSEIFTAALSDAALPINNPLGISTDGTLMVVPIFGKDYFSKEGYTTLPLNQGGYTPELFTKANSTDKYIDAGVSSVQFRYKAFAIAWSQPAILTVGSGALSVGGKNGSTVTFAITSNTAWNITSDQLWLTAVPSSGTGNATVTLTTQANPNAVNRTAKITVTGTGATSQEITVTQSFNTGISSAKVNVLGMVPNPATGKVRLTVPGNINIVSVAITDIRGRQLFTALRLTGDEMDLSPLLPGIYLVRVVTGREVFNGKLVKE